MTTDESVDPVQDQRDGAAPTPPFNAQLRYAPNDSGAGPGSGAPQSTDGERAVASPFARPRDVHGNGKNGLLIYNHVPPTKGDLDKIYGGALTRMEGIRPLRAAVLRDKMRRVDAAIERFDRLSRQEEIAIEAANERAQTVEKKNDEEIDALRTRRDELEEQHDENIADRRSTYAKSRIDLAKSLAANSIGLTMRNWGAHEDPDVFAKSPSIDAGGAQGVGDPALPSPPEPTKRNDYFGVRSLFGRFGIGRNRSSEARALDLEPETIARSAPDRTTMDVPGAAPPARPVMRPVAVPFPVAEAEERARTEQVIALDAGLPATHPSSRIFPDRGLAGAPLRIGLAMVTLASGTIFGASIGLLLGIFRPELASFGARQQFEILAICAAFGTALFWSLGKSVQALAALLAEEIYSALLAKHHDDRQAAGQWFRRTGWVLAGVSVTIVASLVVIEAVVERFGIVKLFIDGMTNQILLHHAVAPQPPSSAAIICLTLIASAPFVILHAVQGWTLARAELLSNRLRAGREHDVWTTARQMHDERVAQARDAATAEHEADRAAYEDALKARRAEEEQAMQEPGLQLVGGRVATGPADTPARSPFAAPNDGYGAGDEETPTRSAAGDEAPSHFGADTAADGQTAPHAGASPPGANSAAARREALAQSNEETREAYARLREAHAKRRDAVSRIDERIATLEGQRNGGQVEMSAESKKRMEDAYSDVIGTIIMFEAAFAKEARAYERWARGGIFVRIAAFFNRPAIG